MELLYRVAVITIVSFTNMSKVSEQNGISNKSMYHLRNITFDASSKKLKIIIYLNVLTERCSREK